MSGKDNHSTLQNTQTLGTFLTLHLTFEEKATSTTVQYRILTTGMFPRKIFAHKEKAASATLH